MREFTRELVHGIHRAAKLVWLFSAALLVGSLLYLAHAALLHYRVEDQNFSQTEILKQRIEAQERRLAHLSEQQNRLPSDLTTGSDLKQADRSARHRLSLPTRLWKLYGDGICLIAGSYILTDPTGRPLRYPEVELPREELLLTNGKRAPKLRREEPLLTIGKQAPKLPREELPRPIGKQAPLTVEGNGVIFELEFFGTGFYVGDGYVLTNRHIASQPWALDEQTQSLISSLGVMPRLERLLAFFPTHRQPIALKFRTASEIEDVAVCTLKRVPSDIPVLPLDRQSSATRIGKAVVMMGFPTGPNRLLALLPKSEALAVEEQYGNSLETLLDQLGKRKLIKPLTTLGHITDLYKNHIVFDAAITDGSSGTPMIGESGKVIGITFALFLDDGASNFAVSIAAGLDVLKKAGWKTQIND